jgi:histidinol-phosphate aminotransferase
MSRYWSDVTKTLTPYVPGEQPKEKKYIKLNTNENPYPPSPKVISAMKEAVNNDLRLYPDPTCERLVETVAEYYGLAKDEIFVGNGSDEILGFAFMAFFNPDQPIIFPDITYSFYKVYAKLYNLRYQLVSLDDHFDIPLDSLIHTPHGGMVIANPNAPTAKYIPSKYLKKVLDSCPSHVVIIDEAYIDFGGESAIELIQDYPNLLVVQTLSKSRSLAGLRVGVAFGHPDLIEGLNRIKNSFNSYTIDRIALSGAAAAFEDEAYFVETSKKVIATRERIILKLNALGFRVLDSKANFVFITHPKFTAKLIFQSLRDNGVLVRYFDLPRIDNFLRVSIGTESEMEEFMKLITEIVE